MSLRNFNCFINEEFWETAMETVATLSRAEDTCIELVNLVFIN